MTHYKPVDYQTRNLRGEQHSELKAANVAWMDCISKNFMNQWLAGNNVNISEVCTEEHSKMQELDVALYEPTLPFRKSAME